MKRAKQKSELPRCGQYRWRYGDGSKSSWRPYPLRGSPRRPPAAAFLERRWPLESLHIRAPKKRPMPSIVPDRA